MAERKNKRESAEPIELEGDENGFVLHPAQIEVGSGYTVCLSYDENDKPIVNVKTYGQVDTARLHKEIARIFPNAQIRQLRSPGIVTIAKKRSGRDRKKKK